MTPDKLHDILDLAKAIGLAFIAFAVLAAIENIVSFLLRKRA